MEQNLIQIAHKHSAYANEIDILYNPTLTKEDATNWKKVKRVEIIPNFSVMPVSKQSDIESTG